MLNKGKEKMTTENKRRIFREKRFDNSVVSYLKFLAGIAVCMIGPIAAAITTVIFAKKNYGFEIGSVAAAVCGWLMISGIAASCVCTFFFARSCAVGNKFKYFIIDEKNRLLYVDSGKGAIYNYFVRNVNIKEKIKSTPNALFGLTFFHALKPFIGGFNYILAERFFKYNQKHKLAEKLLSGENYLLYCHQICAVKNIKFFPGGCTVSFSTVQNGGEIREKCHIYNTMEGYSEIVEIMIGMIYGGNSEAIPLSVSEKYSAPTLHATDPVGADRLSSYELVQARKMMSQKNRSALILAVLFIALAAISILQRDSSANKAYGNDMWIFSRLYIWLSARAYRRMCISLLCALISVINLVRCIKDIISANNFTRKEIDSISYLSPQKSNKAVLGNYQYTASADYTISDCPQTVILGVSKQLWENRRNGKAVLVMKGNVPYFLVLEKQE